MPHKKRRVVQSMMEEKSLAIVRNKLPKEWVLHQYAPDYGIDFVVETFEFIDEAKTIAETLGEFFFVQLKSEQKIEKSTLTVKSRYNIEKSFECNTDEQCEIEVIKYPLDVDELYTVLSMGTAVPTVLFLTDLSSETVYFICLNDYLEKILMADESKLENTSTVTLYIPSSNIIDSQECLCHLYFLARRSKLFGAFNKFNYQRHELYYDESPEIILHFISIIKKYDFWDTKLVWPALTGMHTELLEIEKFLTSSKIDEKRKILIDKGFADTFIDDTIAGMNDLYIKMLVLPFWDKLCNLGHIYEEICKEWFLPTFLWSTYNLNN